MSSKWATVTATGPLAVQVDGDTSALPFTPDSLTDPTVLAVGDRVWCEITDRRVVVHGRKDGVSLADIESHISDLDSDVTDLQSRASALETRPQGVVPSSVVVGSGSASVAADGTVTFTGASSVSLNNVFDGSGMDAYRITMHVTGSAAAGISSRLRAAGVDVTASSGAYTAIGQTLAAGPTRASGTTANAFAYWYPTTAGAPTTAGTLTLLRPNVSATKLYLLDSLTYGGSDRYMWHEGGTPNTTSACDGLTVFPGSGTITGWIKVVKIG